MIYPVLGLGVLASEAKLVTDGMLSAAAHSLGGIVDPNEKGAPVLPPVSKIQSFSAKEAVSVAQAAIDENLVAKGITDAKAATEKMKWIPKY